MSGFAALLKLSQSQTAQSELEVQAQIASHQLHLEKKRREQEVKERKERELETKFRAKQFEEQRKEEERKRKRVEEERARERELAKREEQMRLALKYGPRKSSAPGSSKGRVSDNGGEPASGLALTREELRKQNETSDFASLTREEKRQRKLDAELRKTSSSRRTGIHRTTSLPNGHTVRRLPGGAVDYTTVSRLADPDAPPPLLSSDLAGKSARERLAAMPSTLLKLNTVKRDVRTIDEILIDRAKAKQTTVLAGDDAKDFSDWFGKNKKKEKAASQLSTQQQLASVASSPALSATSSGSPAPTVNPFSGAASAKTKAATLATPTKPSSPFLKPINPKPITVPRPSGSTPSLPSSKKRPRSPTDSDSALPSFKRRPSTSSRPAATASRPVVSSRPSVPSSRQSALSNGVDISTEIWNIFGKDKKSYVARDILSDDEDMEADAQSVLKEEARSARLALKEDEHAFAEERRREDEKRKRKKERERREKS